MQIVVLYPSDSLVVPIVFVASAEPFHNLEWTDLFCSATGDKLECNTLDSGIVHLGFIPSARNPLALYASGFE